MGVSATHLDWTMVPYVRKSFYKHFKEGFKYFHPEDTFVESSKEDIIKASIDDDDYKYYSTLYKYAMDMTTKEVYQAVEGMYHNLSNWAA